MNIKDSPPPEPVREGGGEVLIDGNTKTKGVSMETNQRKVNVSPSESSQEQEITLTAAGIHPPGFCLLITGRVTHI